MIADVANRVVKLIHRFVNRMNIAGLQPALPRNEVAERIALQKIAVVDKNAVTDFGTPTSLRGYPENSHSRRSGHGCPLSRVSEAARSTPQAAARALIALPAQWLSAR
jgi:hypothetical protein